MINTINAFNRIIEETLITNLIDSLKSKNFHPHNSMMNIMVDIMDISQLLFKVLC